MQPLPHEPHKIKTIRPISFPTIEERKKYLAEAYFNVFNLTPSQVGLDMCSLGTSAMTQEQLSGQLIGDEAYAGARNFERLKKAVVPDRAGSAVKCRHLLASGDSARRRSMRTVRTRARWLGRGQGGGHD